MADFLDELASTVFMCETTDDHRYIRCDFIHCDLHSLNKEPSKIPVDYWSLNTENNVSLLEKHVSNKVYEFVAGVELLTREDYETNTNVIKDGSITCYEKVLVVFNLRDPQSNFGPWISSFLNTVKLLDGDQTSFICITFSFASRKELFQQIAKLKDMGKLLNTYEVMIVLSCHSSSQGQVFSCTPTSINKTFQFEEFCSLHDFVCACQKVFGKTLKIIHVSSCFALKLNCSHMDWPVKYTWLASDLYCILSGSAKEVYETGSQTADLYLVLNIMLSTADMMSQYKKIFADASSLLFPDLVLEMGLTFIDPYILHCMMENPDKEDKVTPPSQVLSNIHLVIICSDNNKSVLLKDSLICNLQNRILSDVKSVVSGICMDPVEISTLHKDLEALNIQNKEIFFLILTSFIDHKDVLQSIVSWKTLNKHIPLFGVHFTDLNPDISSILVEQLQAYDILATGFLNNQVLYKDSCPLLLYSLHLLLGENGKKVYSPHEDSSIWTLKDIHEEASHVLPGFANRCQFVLLNGLTSRQKHSSASLCPQSVPNSDVPQVIPNSSLYKNQNFPTDENFELQSFHQNILSSQQGNSFGTRFDTDFIPRDAEELTKGLKDVPLMANVDEVLIRHFVLYLDVDFSNKSINGVIILFISPANEDIAKKDFQMCLDCTLIDIQSVKEVSLPPDFETHFQDTCCCRKHGAKQYDSCSQLCNSCSFLTNYSENERQEPLNYKTLPYSLHGWCIRVWKNKNGFWPRAVVITYKTTPCGPSLMWCHDQDSNPCCFTPGAYINNRSMMPCQEPPVAMSTWQAFIKVPKGYHVLSSGNKHECKQTLLNAELSEKALFYYEMDMPLPSSTMSFAFGKFAKSSRNIEIECPPLGKKVEVTFYSSQSKIQSFEDEYLELTGKYLYHACDLLSEYPFARLDLVLMPRSFACMGLESPNLMFISQSILCGDQSMCAKIAHEITHAWFGLVIGTKDWTEEWLSEGFATYLEERIIAREKQVSHAEYHNEHELLKLLKYKTLTDELQELDDDNLKLMRPKKNAMYISAKEAVNNSLSEDNTTEPKPQQVVTNAAIPSKKFSQVHYLKGYFLLDFMANNVGYEAFDEFLKYYVKFYKGALVTSEMVFDLYINYFKLNSTLKNELVADWLENTDLPKIVFNSDDVLMTIVVEEVEFWKRNNISNKRCKSRGVKRKLSTMKERPLLTCLQIIHLLEYLLKIENFLPQTLTQLNHVYKFQNRNAEIRHRWCELVVKHKYFTKLDDVRHFLTEDQGMGIYLFGELMLSENSKLTNLAKQVFENIRNEMDSSTKETVREMIFGIVED